MLIFLLPSRPSKVGMFFIQNVCFPYVHANSQFVPQLRWQHLFEALPSYAIHGKATVSDVVAEVDKHCKKVYGCT
jgi:hypothetical protein